MPAKSRSRSEALEPSDPTAATASRIVSHMNGQHKDSLVLFLQYFGRVWFLSARSPRMLSLDRAGMKIASTGPLGTEASPGLHTTITFEPPLKPDLSDARTRMIDMDKEARRGLGRKDETVATYKPPQGPVVWVWWGFVAFSWVLLSRTANLDEGSIFMRTLLRPLPAWVVEWMRMWNPRFFRLMLGLHLLETAEMVTGKLRNYNVEFWSPVWWGWTLSCLFEGFTVWGRFDEVAKEVKEQNEKSH